MLLLDQPVENLDFSMESANVSSDAVNHWSTAIRSRFN
jgi:hypothetical protein